LDKFLKRSVAKRVFSFELNEATYKVESDEKLVQILLPTGTLCSRVFIVGVLLDREETRPDSDFWKIRVSDPTGVFRGFVGKFQPDALENLLKIDPPEIVAIVSKVRIFEGTTSNLVTLRPEVIVPVERDVMNYWILETAEQTLKRIKDMKKGESELVEMAWKIYNPDLSYYESKIRDAVSAILKVEKEEEVSEEEIEEETADISESFEEDLELEIPDIDEFEFEEEEIDLNDILG